MSSTAYLFAVIDIASYKVREYRIFSDRHPTVAKPGTLYGLILDATGSDFGQAYLNCIKAAQGWIPSPDLAKLTAGTEYMGVASAQKSSADSWDAWPLGAPETKG